MRDAGPELVADCQCITGENPLWHPAEKRLYWTDIPTGRMFRYSPADRTHERFYQGEVVGGFTIQSDGSLLLFMDRGAVKVWEDGQLTTVVDSVLEERKSRFNDVIADPKGRVFCGTIATKEGSGSLYRLDRDGTLTRVLGGVECSNGMGFAPGRRAMYHTDSGKREICLFDYDVGTGEICNRRRFLRLPQGQGTPDGMTVDSEGFVWSAIWDGGRLARYRPDGREDSSIPFLARKVSSVIFGGSDYADMYVTTAGADRKDIEGPGAGGLFRLKPGATGLPEYPSRVCL